MPKPDFDPQAYWKRTIRRILILVGIWFLVGPVMGILLVERLNEYTMGNIPLGFWMGQQGAIYVFVILIFVNAYLADRTDREFDLHETASTTQHIRRVE
jgi:putative solute:sodium symporter small subunit